MILLTKPRRICEGRKNNKPLSQIYAPRKIDERSNVKSRDRSTITCTALRFSKRKLVRGSGNREPFVRLCALCVLCRSREADWLNLMHESLGTEWPHAFQREDEPHICEHKCTACNNSGVIIGERRKSVSCTAGFHACAE